MSHDEFWTRPILSVRDAAASVAYFCEKLGFRQRWAHGDPVLIAEVERSGISIILDAGSVLPRAGRPTVLGISLREPATHDELHRRFVERGAKVVRAPFPVIWQANVSQFDVEDLDGNTLMFWS